MCYCVLSGNNENLRSVFHCPMNYMVYRPIIICIHINARLTTRVTCLADYLEDHSKCHQNYYLFSFWEGGHLPHKPTPFWLHVTQYNIFTRFDYHMAILLFTKFKISFAKCSMN